jgi:hypothetical protein
MYGEKDYEELRGREKDVTGGKKLKEEWSYVKDRYCWVCIMATWKSTSWHALWFIHYAGGVYLSTRLHGVTLPSEVQIYFKPSVYCQGARGLNQQCKSSTSSSYLSPYATSSTAFGSSSGSSSHHSGQSGASSGQTASYASYGAGYNCTASTATGFTAGSQAFPSQQVCMWHVMLQCSSFFADMYKVLWNFSRKSVNLKHKFCWWNSACLHAHTCACKLAHTCACKLAHVRTLS